MTKKNKRNLQVIISGLIIINGLYYTVEFNNDFTVLLAVVILSPLFSKIIVGLIPTKKATTKKKTSKINNVQKRNRLKSDNEIIKLDLDNMSWREFERLCFLYFKAKGYNPRETKEGADGGIDLIIYDKQHKTDVAVQIKHYYDSKRKITVEPIRELVAAKRNYKCVLADFITTSTYTKNALNEADDNNINCYDIHWVENKIIKWKDEQAKKIKRAN